MEAENNPEPFEVSFQNWIIKKPINELIRFELVLNRVLKPVLKLITFTFKRLILITASEASSSTDLWSLEVACSVLFRWNFFCLAPNELAFIRHAWRHLTGLEVASHLHEQSRWQTFCLVLRRDSNLLLNCSECCHPDITTAPGKWKI